MAPRLNRILSLVAVVALVAGLGACGARFGGNASGSSGRGTTATGGLSIPFP